MFEKGDTVTLREDKPARYSGYGANPERVIRAGEPLTITHTTRETVPVLRGGRPWYVARTGDDWTVDFHEGDAVAVPESDGVRTVDGAPAFTEESDERQPSEASAAEGQQAGRHQQEA